MAHNFSVNMPITAAALFTGYLAVVGLLVSLAISRHDRVLPVSRAIIGGWNWPVLPFQVFTFLVTELGAPLPITVPLNLLSLIATIVVLGRALDVAFRPEIYDLKGIKIVRSSIQRRVRMRFGTWCSADRSLVNDICMRGILPLDLLLRKNPDLVVVRSAVDGMAVYREPWARKLRDLNGRHETEPGAWLGPTPGESVRTGDVLRVGPPGTWRFTVAWLALTVIPMDLDYWERVRTITESACNQGDRTTFEQGKKILLAGLSALKDVRSGTGPTYGDMWPPGVGAPEAFAIGSACTDLVRNLSRSARALDAGVFLLDLVNQAVESDSLGEAIYWAVVSLRPGELGELKIEARNLGLLLLRQRYFTLEAPQFKVWSALQESFILAATMKEATRWLKGVGVVPDKEANLIGALVILSGAQDDEVSKSFIHGDAATLAQRLQATRPMS